MQRNPNFFELLPDELSLEILRNLPALDRFIVMRASFRFYMLAQDPRLVWKGEDKRSLLNSIFWTVANGRNPQRVDIESLKDLLAKGANPSGVGGTYDSSLLHGAVLANHRSAVIILLGRGANINYQNNAQMTPLHYAAREGNAEIAKLLIDRGASRDLTDYQGKTAADHATDPLLSAAIRSNSGWETIITDAINLSPTP